MKKWTLEEARANYKKKNTKKCCINCKFIAFKEDEWMNEDYYACLVKDNEVDDFDLWEETYCEYFTLKD